MFGNLEKKTGVKMEDVMKLAQSLQNADFQDEKTVRKVINKVSKLAGKPVSKKKEDMLVKAIINGNVPSDMSAIEKLQNGEKIMGFGHRVYKTTDPRATALKEQLLQISPRPDWVDRAVMIEEETVEHLNQLKPGRKLYANVEFYAAALMKSIGIPAELFTPIFCCSRMVGWTAHMMEQSKNNVIFRPGAKYVGDQ